MKLPLRTWLRAGIAASQRGRRFGLRGAATARSARRAAQVALQEPHVLLRLVENLDQTILRDEVVEVLDHVQALAQRLVVRLVALADLLDELGTPAGLPV